MKMTFVALFHFMIWSAFSIVLLLSSRDKLLYKVMLFFVFFYFAYVIAYMMLHSRKEAIFFAITNSFLFFMSKLIFFS